MRACTQHTRRHEIRLYANERSDRKQKVLEPRCANTLSQCSPNVRRRPRKLGPRASALAPRYPDDRADQVELGPQRALRIGDSQQLAHLLLPVVGVPLDAVDADPRKVVALAAVGGERLAP
eukprot:1781926-Prymnesium_polylepis.1